MKRKKAGRPRDGKEKKVVVSMRIEPSKLKLYNEHFGSIKKAFETLYAKTSFEPTKEQQCSLRSKKKSKHTA